MQDEVLQRARVGPKDDDGRFTITEALRDQAVVDLSKVRDPPLPSSRLPLTWLLCWIAG